MSRLAIYDKKYGTADRKRGGYFKWDYIYFRNFWTRAGVFAGCLIITLFYALKKLLIEEVDVLTLDYKLELTKIAFFTIAALVVYTIIGSAVAKGEYKKSKERLEAYFAMLSKLDRLNESGNEQEELESEEEKEEAPNRKAARNQYASQYEPPAEPGGRHGQYKRPEHYEQHLNPLIPGKGAKPPEQRPVSDTRAQRDNKTETAQRSKPEGTENNAKSLEALMRFREVRRRDGNNN